MISTAKRKKESAIMKKKKKIQTKETYRGKTPKKRKEKKRPKPSVCTKKKTKCTFA
jgi:hypothetical protein